MLYIKFYVSGNNLKSLKKNFLYFKKWNFFYLMLKNSCFVFRRTLRVFHFFVFSFLFTSYFSSFLFFLVFISSFYCFFRYFSCSLYLFISLFLRFLLLLLRMLRIWENNFYSHTFFTLHSFQMFGTTCFYQGFPGADRRQVGSLQPWRLQGIPLRFETQTCPSLYLNHTVFGNYIISLELYLNLWKYVDKLLVVKSLINFAHIS